MTIKNFARSFVILMAALLAPLGVAHADPNQGPGGPILVITNGNQNFGKFYAEILRTEGFNEFAVAEIGTVSASTLNNYDVVVVAKVAVTASQASMLATWVDAGGNLVLMDPPASLASLAGITQTAGTLANGYLLVNTSTRPGSAIVNETIQFHGTAQLSSLSGASSLGTLYSSPTAATAFPAITLRNVGINGGQVAAFMFDLATSVVYTRQGNPAWVGQERDGFSPRRSSDLFVGNSPSDPQADWVNLDKVSIPQADEQQRFLANLITEMNADRKPLPRFWYFPHGYRSAVVMTGDDHGYLFGPGPGGATLPRFNQYLNASPPDCSVEDWECVRGTSYLITNGSLTDQQASLLQAEGFEVGLHIASLQEGSVDCANFTLESLTTLYTAQKTEFFNKFPSMLPLSTMRHHCIVWSDWASAAKVELANGIRLDTNYYFWPEPWVQNRPGHMTGSAMPMRFADLDGTLIDVYQAVSQMTDESGQTYPFTATTLLDGAVGSAENYGAYTVNAHTDVPTEIESDSVVAAAQARDLPVISARQLLTWLDGRNNSSFSALNRVGNTLNFTVTKAADARGLQAMVPWRAGTQQLSTLARGGTDVPYEVAIIKGIEYATFPAENGSYAAVYVADATSPTVSTRTPAAGATGVSIMTTVRARFSEALDVATVSASTVELRDAANSLVNAAISYSASTQSIVIVPSAALQNGTVYTVTIRGGATDPRVKDAAGIALAANASWSFTTAAAPVCPCSIWDLSATPETPTVDEAEPVELGVKFRSDVNGYIKGIRFYKGTLNTGVHTGSLWTSMGVRLATGTFTNETATGWQTLIFETPVAVNANAIYVASYYAPNGGYGYTLSQFATAGVDKDYLHALSSPSVGGNGVYKYGPGNSMPTDSWMAANYWVDVLFDTIATNGDPVAPTIQITAPVSTSTYDAAASPLALGGTASDNVAVTQVTWTNDRGGAGVASGTTSWSIAAIPLASGANTITVTARDNGFNSATDTLVVNYVAPPDTTAPTIANRTPASGATNTSLAGVVTVTFDEAMTAASISTSSFELRNASNTLIPATVTYNASTLVATLTPTNALALNSVYTVTVRGGTTDPRVKDAAGIALAANATWSFTTTATNASSIWPSTAVPSQASDPETASVELGVKFRSDIAGFITGIRFYKGPTNSGVHTGTLWSATGEVLGTGTFVNETATGWQQLMLPSPVAIAANTTYVASYLAPNGGYAYDSNAFATSGVDNGTLHALSSPASGGNGVYVYGTGGVFPTGTFNSNYWVDVLFASSIGPDTTAPTVATRSPVSGATNVPTNTPITVSFSENMNATTITSSSFELRNASNVLVPATVSYSGVTATLVPNALLANTSTYTVTVRGGSTDPRVMDLAGIPLAANESWSFTTAAAGGPCAANAITQENCLAGNPASEWDIVGAGDASIQGFATEISVNRGSTVQFKVRTDAANYRFDIYRMGYYGGLGARKITTVNPSATLPQTQPASCLTQASSGLIDCGNWAVSGSWAVPANATSGVYFAKLVRSDTGGSSHIVFIVRNDASTSDLVFQTSDTTWQAYNSWGGNSLYQGSPGTNPGRAYKVSYNRPFNTRANDGGQDWVFNAEYPMIRWLESNGYDVSYITGVDTDRAANLLTSHRAFLSVGHDEYWSNQQRLNVEAARNAGLHLAFFSGNEIFWKTRWENSIDSSGAAYRTLVSYKETHASAKIDPTAVWTGTWRDPRFSPPADGGRPENNLSGTIFTVNAGTAAIVIPAAEGKLRLWRGTSAAGLTGTQTETLPNGTLGYEWDSDLDNGARPAGLFRLSDTTVNNVEKLQDYGSTYALDTANHALTMYRHASGARVFGAGTVQWSWGLDANHDRAGTPVSQTMKQATVNLFADMNVQPATLQAGLTAQTASTDVTAPTVTITSPAAGASLPQNTTIISGTAADVGGQVAGVEVSVDGGTTWRPASGRGTWSYSWTPTTTGAVTIRVRAVDDSSNLNGTPATVAVTVAAAGCPCSIWPTTSPTVAPDVDPSGPIVLGTRFRSSSAGRITAIKFYKDAQNTGTHVGALWSANGTQLAQVTFTGESASGWQVQALSTPVNITANTDYVVSYHTSSGRYTGEDGYFANEAASGPLRAPENGDGGSNGLYKYSASSAFPTDTYNNENYWVDVVFNYASGDTVAPAVTITSPTSATTTTVTATPFALGGTASDAVGVTQVTWANDRGGSGTATGTTSWSVSGVVLQSGANILTVTARDAAGNTSTDSLTVTYNPPDTTAPSVTITSPTSSATTTVATTPINIGGTASDAVGVTEVAWVNNRGGSGNATGTTSWSVSGIVLQSGSNVLTITARDAAGNSSTDTLTVTYTPDTTAPAVIISTPTSASSTTVVTNTVNLGGTASDSVGVTQVSWTNDRGGSGNTTGTTNWSVSGVVLQLGVNVLTVSARDAAGNIGTDSLSVTYTPDTTAPAVTITSPTSNATLAVGLPTLNIGGTSSDTVGVTQVSWVNNRGGSGNASGTTSWSVSGITLQSGSNILTVTARDAAGNTNTDTLTVTYTPDTTAPVVTITGPTSNATLTVTSTPLTISGTASDAVGVTQVTWVNSRGGSGTASGTTSWTVSNIALQLGSNVLTVTARDAAGNTSTDTLTVTYNDAAAPAVTITSPTSNATLSTSVASLNLGGTASDNIGVTQVTWANNRGGSGTATGTTSWSVSGVVLQSGSNVLTVTARDAAGNTTNDTLTVTYTVDTTAPVVTITGPTSNATLTVASTPLTLSGTASDAIGVTQVTWVNSRGGSGTASGTTSWSASGVVLQLGSNVLTVTARDAAGNTSTDTLTVTYNDSTAPAVQITSPTSNSTLTTTVTPLTLGGTASDAVGVTQVSWANNRGGSGAATGTNSWAVSGIVLQSGSNVLTVTARDAAGNVSTDTLTVTYNPDTTAPTVSILSPTSNATMTTTAATVTLLGTASDSVGVTQVTWTNSRGGSGTASGTTIWTASNIPLLTGAPNVLTVTARDAAGNTRTDTLTVTRN